MLSNKHSYPLESYYQSLRASPQAPARGDELLEALDRAADRIAGDFPGGRVLEMGCGEGLLVGRLRQRGVPAWGLEPSASLLDRAPGEIQAFCRVGSPTEPLPERYDLIVCLELLAFLSAEEAEAAVKTICRYADEALVAHNPHDYSAAGRSIVQPPGHWAELFTRHGFLHDLTYDASYLAPWAMRMSSAEASGPQLVALYERRLWELVQENRARRELGIEQRQQLSAQEFQIARLLNAPREIEALKGEIDSLRNSNSWQMIQRLQGLRQRLAPPGSRRERWMYWLLRGSRVWQREGALAVLSRLQQRAAWRARVLLQGWRFRLRRPTSTGLVDIPPVEPRPSAPPHQAQVDIIICVHNALADVQRCLESVVRHTRSPYTLILVDDGSGPETRDFLAGFAREHEAALLRNEQASGYTRAANQGLRQSHGDFALLLNSDTVVTPGWLDAMVACARSNPKMGLVGPLSNTASWQSIPEIETSGDWAANPLPDDLSIDDMAALVAGNSARLYPEMPFLNGFCLMIARGVIEEIGIFDEDNFGAGYGEENDYCLRARQAGWRIALADDAYIYHAQSRSYSHERRKRLSDRAGVILAKKHGQQIIDEGVAYCLTDRVLTGIRARSRVMADRESWVARGRGRFAGRKVLFVLPIQVPGGGGNITLLEAQAMRAMGVEVEVFNLRGHQEGFEQAYPDLALPVLYGEIDDLPSVSHRYDAVIATFNPSVAWLGDPQDDTRGLVRGYYIQDYEPYFYPLESAGYEQARDSYTWFPDFVRFTKTEWTRAEIEKQIGVPAHVVGVSLNLDLFRPRPRPGPEWPDRPLRVAAMIRPSSAYREPRLTMEVLQQASRRFGPRVEFMLFGTEPNDPGFAALPQNFPWSLAGVLDQDRVATLLNEADIFVDFSSHQAMGLTALEAMACGAAVIVPQRGGASSFAKHEENSLAIDTSSPQACWEALRRLIDDHELRTRLGSQALQDVCQYHPEQTAFQILKALFDPTA